MNHSKAQALQSIKMSLIQVLRIICEFKVILKVKCEDLHSWHKMENWPKAFAIYAIQILCHWYPPPPPPLRPRGNVSFLFF